MGCSFRGPIVNIPCCSSRRDKQECSQKHSNKRQGEQLTRGTPCLQQQSQESHADANRQYVRVGTLGRGQRSSCVRKWTSRLQGGGLGYRLYGRAGLPPLFPGFLVGRVERRGCFAGEGRRRCTCWCIARRCLKVVAAEPSSCFATAIRALIAFAPLFSRIIAFRRALRLVC